MEIDALLAFLETLRDAGVQSFSGNGVDVTFFHPEPAPVAMEERAPRTRDVPASNWEDPALWGRGGKPEFHKKPPK